jgi:hypothetical protein
MATVDDIKRWAGQALREVGFRGRRTRFHRQGPDLQWLVDLDRPPYGDRIEVEIGLELQTDTRPTSAIYCGSVLYLDQLPFSDTTAIWRTFDARSDLPDDRRQEEIVAAIHALGEYIDAHNTVGDIRAAYDRGDFRRSAVGIRTMEALGLEIPETPVVKEKPKIVYVNLTKPAG